jgi:PTH2 family peptidyl-tRNA hydrolase
MREVKQVIVLRKDLNMRKGKMIAQGAHASLGAILKNPKALFNAIFKRDRSPLSIWLKNSFTKVVLSVNTEQELFMLSDDARREGIPYAVIRDSGRTEFNGVPTYTAIAIGPYWSDEIDKITGELKLL